MELQGRLNKKIKLLARSTLLNLAAQLLLLVL